jgi:hypothetical protein
MTDYEDPKVVLDPMVVMENVLKAKFVMDEKELEGLKDQLNNLEKYCLKKGEDEDEESKYPTIMSLNSPDKEDASFSVLVHAFMVIKQKEIEQLKYRLDLLEEDEEKKYPNDVYAIISMNSSDHKDGNIMFFAFGFLVWAFQMLFIALLITSVFYSFFRQEEYVDGDPLMVVAEFAAIICYALIPDASLQDIVVAYRLWPSWESKTNRRGRQIACTLRGIQGISASVAVLFLINISPNVIDIILNFAALNFVSDMDSVAFELAKKGVFGKDLRNEAIRIATKDLPEHATKHPEIPYRIVMGACAFVMLTVNIILRTKPEFRENLYTHWVETQPQ